MVVWKMPTFFNVCAPHHGAFLSKKMRESGDNQIKKKMWEMGIKVKSRVVNARDE
jgi:hypothetical protein